MKVIVFGANGMAGHMVALYLQVLLHGTVDCLRQF